MIDRKTLVRVAAFAVLVSMLVLPPGAWAQGKTLRLASAFDPQSMDPHSLALLYQSRVVTQVYEGLVNRGKDFRLEPSLATEWSMVNPTTWRFKLRQGVHFHDGAPFSADDAVFSIERALDKASQRKNQMLGITGAKKIDAATIDLLTAQPDAVLPEKLILVGMVNKAWAEKHNVVKPQDFNARQETFAVRNANGTGPFMLERYEADVRTTLKVNPQWWGRGTAAGGGNLDEVHYQVIQSDATRLAALQSGQVDFVIDPPFQDLARLKADKALKVSAVDDIGTQYFALDQHSADLGGGDLKGRNPFKDLRVRRAVYHAINIELIVGKVLRGQATPTGAFLSPKVDGSPPELDKRLPYDPAKSRALLAEAGYPQGFGVTLDCVNVAWREAVCQAASAMLTQVGIRTSLRSSPTNQFFPKLSMGSASFIEYGWTPNPDAWASLNGLFRSWDKSGLGQFNAGRYSNPRLDVLIDAIRIEPDLTRRRAMVGVALRMVHDDLPYIPLYRRTLTWAMVKNVRAVQWPNDTLELRWVRLQ